MIVRLTPQEIARCIQVYVGAKLGVMPDSLSVRIRWRGEYAQVDTGKTIPTMSDEDKRAISE